MKNFISTLSPLFLSFFLMAATFSPLYSYSAPADQQQVNLSDEDLKFLEEAQKEVERYVGSLPTEAALRAQGMSEEQIKNAETKEKFDREVARLSKMSEEELLKEIEDAIKKASEEAGPEVRPEPIPVRPTPQEEIKQEKPVEIIPSGKQQAALQLLDAVINSISNFLSKAQMMVELPSKIPNWVKEGKLPGWPAALGWNTFKDQLEDLQAKLKKVKDRNPASNLYKYLDDFIKDEILVNNLTKVKDALIRTEPKIALSPFGIDKMSSEARQATRSVLSSLHEAIYVLAIPTALDKIFEKYEPTAKKIKESEEAAQKRAFEQSRYGRIQGPSSVGGLPAREHERYYKPTEKYERPYTPYEPQRAEREKAAESTLKPPAAPGAGGAKKPGEAKKDEEKKGAEKPKYEQDKKAEDLVKKFNEGIETFINTIGKNSNFSELEQHFFKDKDKFTDKKLPDLVRTAIEATRKAAKAAKDMKGHLSKLNDAQKKAYKNALRETFKEASQELDSIAAQITNITKPQATFFSNLLPNQRVNFRSKYYSLFNKQYENELQDFVNSGTAPAGGAPAAPAPVAPPAPGDTPAPAIPAIPAAPPAPPATAVPTAPAAPSAALAPVAGVSSGLIKKVQDLLQEENSVNLETLKTTINELKRAVRELQ